MTLRSAVYIRVSREEQVEGWSLEAQRDQCLMLAQARGWEVVQVYEEPGRSAKTDLRPSFQRMMQQAALRRFDLIVVHKLDRFSRNLTDVVKNVARLKEAGVGLASVCEPWLDTTTPQGEVMLYLFAVLAQWDNQNRARETAKGKEARARAGYWNGGLPFGYTTPGWLKSRLLALDEQAEAGKLSQEECTSQVEEIESWLERWGDSGDGDAIPHPRNAAGALLAFNAYATGTASDTDVAILLNEEGYRTSGNWGEQLFGPDTTRPLLQNRFYLGEVQYKGKWYPGRHPALIPRALFEQCQLVRARRRRRPLGRSFQVRTYPLAGLALCARCETRLRAEANPLGTRYYRDPRQPTRTCDQKMVRAEEAEQAVMGYLSGIRLPGDWRERILQLSRTSSEEARQAEARRSALEGRLERARKLYLMGDMVEEEYTTLREDVRSKLNALQPVQEPDLEEAARLLENIGELLTRATPEELREVFHSLLDSVYLDSGEGGPLVAVEPKPFVKTLMDVSNSQEQPGSGGSGGSDARGFGQARGDRRESQFVQAANCDTIPTDAGEIDQMVGERAIPVAPAPNLRREEPRPIPGSFAFFADNNNSPTTRFA